MSIEIPLGAKYQNRPTGRYKSHSSNSQPARTKKASKEQIERDRHITTECQMVKILDLPNNGKIRWMRKADWDAQQ